MSPTQIETHTVDLILQYISPPTNLHQIPSYLISKSLLQRHHFLQISVDIPGDYLCWPSNVQSDVIDILESRSLDEYHSMYQFRYTFDGDFAYAHVGITPGLEPGLRLIFQWDDPSKAWRYHDSNLMPFPPGATESPHPTSNFIMDEHISHENPPLILSPDPSTDNDDAYWNAYGADGEHVGSAPNSLSDKDSSTEDAYWARYSSVHGTADSTQPSPLPRRENMYLMEDPNPNYQNVAVDSEVLSIPMSMFHPGRQPSPSVLAHVLSSLSPREQPDTPPTSDTPSEQGSTTIVGDIDSEVEPEVCKRIHDMGVYNLKQPSPLKYNGSSSIILQSGSDRQLLPQVDRSRDREIAFKDVIQGVYRLWKVQGSGKDGKEQFLRLVQEAIA